MRLWHESLIAKLPRQQLLGQHRECCALRGNGWQKPHSTVNYIFSYSPYKLYQYHRLIITEMVDRGYQPDEKWQDPVYRGLRCDPYVNLEKIKKTRPIFSEHNFDYLVECLDNLSSKGIAIDMEGYSLFQSEIFLRLRDPHKKLVQQSYNNLVLSDESNEFEREWAKYKYLVLEHSHQIYLDIRSLLKAKESIQLLQFLSLICEALGRENEGKKKLNSIDHVWGYFKKIVTEEEKETYKILKMNFVHETDHLTEIKRFLFELTMKYDISYLKNSYYFINDTLVYDSTD